MTEIWELKEGDGDMHRVATFSIPPKQALVAYIMQTIEKDFSTWQYPEKIAGMRESQTVADHWYYDDFARRRVLAAYPKGFCK